MRRVTVLLMVLAAVSAAAMGGSQTKTSTTPPSPEGRDWAFSCNVENRSGHKIHLRFLENGEEIQDVVVPPTDDQRPGSTWNLRSTGFVLRSDARDLEVEETEFLKMRRVFRIAGFKDRPEKNFRVVVTAGGIDLSQDVGSGATPDSEGIEPSKFKEHMAGVRQTLPSFRFFVYNKTGSEIDVRVNIDGRDIFHKAVPATWDDFFARRYMSVEPILVESGEVSMASKALVVEETRLLKQKRTFDLRQEWKKSSGDFVIYVKSTGIEFKFASLALH
jgi:hypothetical protein